MTSNLNSSFWSTEGMSSKQRLCYSSLFLTPLHQWKHRGLAGVTRTGGDTQVANSEGRCLQRPSAGIAREAAPLQHSCSVKAAETNVSDRAGESHIMTSLSLSSRCLSKGGGAEKLGQYSQQRVRRSRGGWRVDLDASPGIHQHSQSRIPSYTCTKPLCIICIYFTCLVPILTED